MLILSTLPLECVKIQHTPETNPDSAVILAEGYLCEIHWSCKTHVVAKNFVRNDSATKCQCITLQNDGTSAIRQNRLVVQNAD